MCSQVARAIGHLHQTDLIAHGDIKPDNFMFTDEYTLALIDFGHSCAIDHWQREHNGTPIYNPPEAIEGEYRSIERSDIF